MFEKLKRKLRHGLMRNILIVFRGNILASVIVFINMTILVRAVGIEKNGIIFMSLAYAMLFNSLFNFQSFDAIIRFVPRVFKESKTKTVVYLKQGFLLDFTTAFLAISIGLIVLNFVGVIMKWDNAIKNCVYIYIFIILFRTTGTMMGVLRVYDKFSETVYANIAEVSFKLVFFLIGYFIRVDIYYYAIFDVLSAGVSMSVLWFYTYKTVKEQGLKFRHVKWKIDKEFLKFNLYSNLETVADLPVQQVTPFIINKFLGFSDITIFKIIEKIGSLVIKVVGAIGQALAPDLSNRIARKEIDSVLIIHKRIIKYIGIFGILGVFLVSSTSFVWIKIFMPATFMNILTLTLYLIYIICTNMFMALHPIFNYLGYIKKNIPILIVSNIIYLITLVVGAIYLGIIGVIIAKMIQATMVIGAKEIILRVNKYEEKIV